LASGDERKVPIAPGSRSKSNLLGGVAEDAEETPSRPIFCVGAREEMKTRGGSLSSEGANAAVQAERSKPTKF
jgi:hypothetical protein